MSPAQINTRKSDIFKNFIGNKGCRFILFLEDCHFDYTDRHGVLAEIHGSVCTARQCQRAKPSTRAADRAASCSAAHPAPKSNHGQKTAHRRTRSRDRLMTVPPVPHAVHDDETEPPHLTLFPAINLIAPLSPEMATDLITTGYAKAIALYLVCEWFTCSHLTNGLNATQKPCRRDNFQNHHLFQQPRAFT